MKKDEPITEEYLENRCGSYMEAGYAGAYQEAAFKAMEQAKDLWADNRHAIADMFKRFSKELMEQSVLHRKKQQEYA